tara:strand:+ start:5172 stop:6140 length:969 start_codon:yes stop_codon:yes gene_type:complete
MSQSQITDTPYGSINIYLQSRDAQIAYSDANVVFYLNDPIIPPRNNVRMLIALTEFQCAYSWYLVRAGVNDTFIFSMTQAGVTTTYTCVLPEGNYDVNSFISTMYAVVFPASIPPVPQGVGNDTKFVYDLATNKLTLENSDPLTTNITIFSKDNGTTLDTEVGMRISGNESVAGAIAVLPNMVNFGGIPNVYVMAPTLGLQNRDGRGENNLCLGKCPVSCRPGGFVYLPQGSFVYLMLDDREIKKLQLQLQDDENNILDLHGIDWSVTLSIHYQYQRLPTIDTFSLDNGEHVQVPTEVKEEPVDSKLEEERNEVPDQAGFGE